jgi:hypothetical protein
MQGWWLKERQQTDKRQSTQREGTDCESLLDPVEPATPVAAQDFLWQYSVVVQAAFWTWVIRK